MADQIDGIRKLGLLLKALRTRQHTSQPTEDEIRITQVDAVLANGHFSIGGAEIPTTGHGVPLRAGQKVAVVYQQGKPLAITQWSARRAQFPATPPNPGGGIIEELFIGRAKGITDVYFRNDQAIKALGVRDLIGGNPEQVKWGQTPEFFVVARGAVRYIFKLKRSPAKVVGPTAPKVTLDSTVTLNPNALVVGSYLLNYSTSNSGPIGPFSEPVTVADCFLNNTLTWATGNLLASMPDLAVDERGHLIATFQFALTFTAFGSAYASPFDSLLAQESISWTDTAIWDLTASTKLYSSKDSVGADFPGVPAAPVFDTVDWGTLPTTTTVLKLCRNGDSAHVAFSATLGYFPNSLVRALWFSKGVIAGLYGFCLALQSGGKSFSATESGIDGDFFTLDDPVEACSFTPGELTQPLVAAEITQARVIRPTPAYDVIPPTPSDNSVFTPSTRPSQVDVFQFTRRRIVLKNANGADPLFGQLSVTSFTPQDHKVISDATGTFKWESVWNLKALSPDFLYAPDVAQFPVATAGKKPPFFVRAWNSKEVTIDLRLPVFPVVFHALDPVKGLLTLPSGVTYASGTPSDPTQTTFIAVNDQSILGPLGQFTRE